MLKNYPPLVLLTLILLGVNTNLLFSQSFVDINAGLTGFSNGSAMWGDYDNDKDLDILITGITSGNVAMTKIYNNDAGIFTDINAGLPGLNNGDATWGDYDNDGDLDILMTGINADQKTFLYKNNEGSFEMVSVNLGYFDAYSFCCWGDYDNDGDLDAFITGNWNSSLFRNDGDDNFIATDDTFVMMNSGRAVFTDMDKDGDLDLLFTGDTGGGMKIYYYGNDHGVFTEQQIMIQGLSAGSIETGDYDNDGDPDILMMGYNDYLEPHADIFRNDGDLNFTPIYAGLAPVTLGKASWGDVDNDGDLDCAVTGKLSGCGVFVSEVYENIGNDYFNGINAGLADAEYSYLAWGDYDNDSDLDLVLSGANYSGTHFTKIYRNDMGLPNFLPEAPQNLTVDFTGDEVIFSWDPAFDQQTPADGLSYNLRLGTEPEGCSNLSPMAHLSDGYRLLATPGNTTQTNWWRIKGLEEGMTYFWSVQAIDPAFGASAFSDEMSFTVVYTGIEHKNNQTGIIQISPNPAKDFFQIDLFDNIPATINICNSSGEKVSEQLCTSANNNIDIRGFKPGIYIININGLNHTFSQKLLVR